MAKNSHEIKVGIPGIAQYSWYKEISKKKANINFIKHQIESFILLIENKDKIKIGDYHREFKEFIKLIPAQGHLARLEKVYQEKFFKITKFVKDHLSELGIFSL